MGKYKDLDDIAKEIAESLNTKDILVYAFNATGKTRLSVLLDKNDYEEENIKSLSYNAIVGYDRDKAKGTYVINSEQAETVRMIYDMYSAGKGMSQIRNELIRLKRKDSSGLVRWENCKIARILHNSTYKGTLRI